MCGIFGYSFKPGAVSEGKRAILGYRLADENDDRGGHSWGYAVLDSGLAIKRGLGKLRGHAHGLVGAQTIFGHTRWATHGDKTVENAHPFEIGDIVGAHNGIIYNHAELCAVYERQFAVDSMHIFAHLHEGRGLEDLEGYGSIEWVTRQRPDVVNLAMLDGGELAVYGIGTEDDLKGVAWSSDSKDLESALRAAGLKKHFAYRVDEGQVYQVSGGEFRYVPDQTLELSTRPRQTTLRWQDFGFDDADGNLLDVLEKDDFHGDRYQGWWPQDDKDDDAVALRQLMNRR